MDLHGHISAILKGWSNEVAAKFKITSIPQNILIDPNGIIIAKNLRGDALNRKARTIYLISSPIAFCTIEL